MLNKTVMLLKRVSVKVDEDQTFKTTVVAEAPIKILFLASAMLLGFLLLMLFTSIR